MYFKRYNSIFNNESLAYFSCQKGIFNILQRCCAFFEKEFPTKQIEYFQRIRKYFLLYVFQKHHDDHLNICIILKYFYPVFIFWNTERNSLKQQTHSVYDTKNSAWIQINTFYRKINYILFCVPHLSRIIFKQIFNYIKKDIFFSDIFF